MSRDIKLYISDILEQMNNAETFIGNMNIDQFSEDKKTAFAVGNALDRDNWQSIKRSTGRNKEKISGNTVEEYVRDAR